MTHLSSILRISLIINRSDIRRQILISLIKFCFAVASFLETCNESVSSKFPTKAFFFSLFSLPIQSVLLIVRISVALVACLGYMPGFFSTARRCFFSLESTCCSLHRQHRRALMQGRAVSSNVFKHTAASARDRG